MKRYHISAIFFIIILIPILYLNTLDVPFQFDDKINIVEVEPIHVTTLSISAFKGVILNKAAIRRPVTNITFALNYYFGELDVFGYHLVNIIIHIITAMAIYLFLYATLEIWGQGSGVRGQGIKESWVSSFGFRDRSFWIAFIATLLWTTSPVQTQAVTYIVQRATSMATMFYMLSLLCYVKGRIMLGVRSKGMLDGLLASGFWLLASLFFALLAFGTKEISATLPLVIILYEIYFFTRFDTRSIRRISLYIGILASLFVVIGLIYIGGEQGIIEGLQSVTAERKVLQHSFTRLTRLITEFRVIIYYITLLILPLPSRLRFVYEFPVSHSLFDPISTFFCMLIIIGIIGYGIYICKKRPVISFFILWFFINLAIESSILRLWLVFEHRLYLPSIGFFVIAAIGITRLIDIVKDRSRPPDSSTHNNYLLLTACCSIFVCVILLQSVWTIQRNFIWRDKSTMLYDNMKKEPHSSDLPFFLAHLYHEQKDLDLAIKYYKEAVQIDPYFSSAYYRLGRVYEEIGETDKAIKQYQEAIRYSPSFSDPYINLGSLYYDQGKTDKAIRLYKIVKRITQDNRYVYPYVHLGEIYKDQGRWEMAINEYKTAIEILPEDSILHNELGLLYKKIGRTDLSIGQYQKALAIDPDFSDAHYNLGLIFFEQNNFDKALNKFKEALRGNPDYSAAHYNIGVILYEQGKIESAIREYKKALEIVPDNPEASYNLAYALESTGKIEDAISYYERFLEIAERDKYKEFIEKTRGRLRKLKRD